MNEWQLAHLGSYRKECLSPEAESWEVHSYFAKDTEKWKEERQCEISIKQSSQLDFGKRD